MPFWRNHRLGGWGHQRITKPTTESANALKKQGFANERSVYIGNLSASATEAHIREAFCHFGDIEAVFVNAPRPGQAMEYTYGFVCFSSREAAQKVLDYNIPISIAGRVLEVRARDRKNQNRRANKKRLLSSPPPSPVALDDEPPMYTAVEHAHSPSPPNPLRGYISPENPYLDSPKSIPPHLIDPGLSFTPPAENDEELVYDKDGLIRIRDSSKTGYVNRVDAVPMNWNARDLFAFLSNLRLCVSAVLVYNDCDERGLKQGLAQFEAKSTVQNLCKWGLIEGTMGLKLEFYPSEIPSIGPVQRMYRGSFSAFNSQDLNTIHKSEIVPPVDSPLETPVETPMETPFEEETPPTAHHYSRKDKTFTIWRDEGVAISDQPVPSRSFETLPSSLLKLSQSILIDNAPSIECMRDLLAGFTEHIVDIDEVRNRSRAYIQFASPLDADAASKQLDGAIVGGQAMLARLL